VTSTAVTARVVGAAVRRGASVINVLWGTSTEVTGDQVRAGAVISTRVTGTLIYVDFTVAPCVVTPQDAK